MAGYYNPAVRATQNEVLTKPEPNAADPNIENEQPASALNNTDQPPFFIQLSRKSPTTVELTNPITGSLLYTVRDTGRGSFSSKPDYEIFRPGPSDLFVGSIRIGKKEVDTKFPLTGAKLTDTTKFTSSYMPTLKSQPLQWRVVSKGRTEKAVAEGAVAAIKSLTSPQVAVLECFAGSDAESPICILKLYDSIPNGRIEVWTADACVEVGGDWNALDQLVVLGYANMEKVRRQMMRGVDQGTWSAGMVV